MIKWKTKTGVRRRKLPRSRGNQRFSRWLKPLFENRRLKSIFGLNLALAIVLVNSMGNIGGPVPLDPPETAVLTAATVSVLTETTFRMPLAENAGYSQGFYRLHPGVDIRAPRKTPVFPAAAGMVTEVELGRFGYGHKIVVSHQNQIQTLYAHLDQVNVKPGDSVFKDTIIGTVGMTGWTTGPHLHFEVRTKEGFINPKQILPEVN